MRANIVNFVMDDGSEPAVTSAVLNKAVTQMRTFYAPSIQFQVTIMNKRDS